MRITGYTLFKITPILFLMYLTVPLYGQASLDKDGSTDRTNTQSSSPLLKKEKNLDRDAVLAQLLPQTESVYTYKPLLSIKSNLLFDVVGALNLEVEVPVTQKWSLNAETQFPWWLNRNSFAMQLLSMGVEGRYWPFPNKDRRIMTGHFVGIYAGMGLYDFQFKKDKGYQGEFYIPLGISYGYVLPIINENFSLEFSIGIGYMRTNYRRYDVSENRNNLVRRYKGKYDWFGPTKAKISFSWLLNRKVKTSTK